MDEKERVMDERDCDRDWELERDKDRGKILTDGTDHVGGGSGIG